MNVPPLSEETNACRYISRSHPHDKKTELQAWKHKKHDYNATQITGNLRIETNTKKVMQKSTPCIRPSKQISNNEVSL